MLDEMDIKILRILQEDCTRPVAEIGKDVGLSTTPCWRRIQKLEEAGVIQRRVAILDPRKVNAGVTVLVSIKTDQHSHAWLERFHGAVADFPEAEFFQADMQSHCFRRIRMCLTIFLDGVLKMCMNPPDFCPDRH